MVASLAKSHHIYMNSPSHINNNNNGSSGGVLEICIGNSNANGKKE